MQVVGYPQISSEDSWKNSYMLLGKTIHEIVEHFQLNPPKILEIQDGGFREIQPNLPAPPDLAGLWLNGSAASANSAAPAPPDHHTFVNTPLPEVNLPLEKETRTSKTGGGGGKVIHKTPDKALTICTPKKHPPMVFFPKK